MLMAVVLGLPAASLSELVAPDAAAAVVPTPSAPMRVIFEAGTHTGYTFSSSGAVTGSRTATLSRPSSASTSRRGTITGRGVHLLITNGIFAGYQVPESIVAHVEGIVSQAPYAPPRRLSFPAGTVVGYRFDASWRLTTAAVIRLSAASGASASQSAVINGVTYYQIVDGGLAGTWVPAGAPGAVKALACQTGPRATGGEQVLRTIPGAGPEVALTFDMGGRVDPALAIMKRLLLHGVCATIFPTGAMSQTAVGQQVLAMVRAHPRIFEVGNHTMHHCDLVRGGFGSPTTAPCATGGPPSKAFVQKQLTDAAAIIQAGTGQSPVPYWRPPYGSTNATVQSWVAALGYTKTMMWDIDTIDWKEVADGGPTAAQIAAKVVARAVNGSDVLMHLGGWNTHDALPAMIHGLRSRGFTPSTISDLMDGR